MEEKAGKRKRQTKYMDKCPEIERILKKPGMRSTKNILIFNGNITTPIRHEKTTFIVNNTCSFDSVVFAIGISYTDHSNYKHYIDKSNNSFLNLTKELSCYGSTAKTYKQRAILLKEICPTDTSIQKLKLINAECNVSKIINELLKDEPSNEEEVICTSENCPRISTKRTSPVIMLTINENRKLNTEGIQSLQDILKIYTNPKPTICRMDSCGGETILMRTLKNHIFIDVESFCPGKVFQCYLQELPKKLNFENYE